MTLNTIKKYRSADEAQKVVNVLREHVPAMKVKEGVNEVNDYDIMRVRDKMRELLRPKEHGEREITEKQFNIYWNIKEIVDEMIEGGEK